MATTITGRISGAITEGSTQRVDITVFLNSALSYEGDTIGRILLQGDAQPGLGGDVLLLEGDALSNVVDITQRVPGGITESTTKRVVGI